MSDETKAKLLYATVGAALDCGASIEEIKRLFKAVNIDKVAGLIFAKMQPGADHE